MRAALLLLAGCWTGASAPAEPPPEVESAFEITLARSTCVGACPAYTVSIDGDGRVHWNGIEYVHDHGVRRATVPRKRIAEIQRKLDELRFFERDPLGNLHGPADCIRTQNGTHCTFTDTTICSHTSTAVVTVRRAHRTHIVRNDHCEPSPLDDLEALVDDIARTSAWIGGRVDTPIDRAHPPP